MSARIFSLMRPPSVCRLGVIPNVEYGVSPPSGVLPPPNGVPAVDPPGPGVLRRCASKFGVACAPFCGAPLLKSRLCNSGLSSPKSGVWRRFLATASSASCKMVFLPPGVRMGVDPIASAAACPMEATSGAVVPAASPSAAMFPPTFTISSSSSSFNCGVGRSREVRFLLTFGSFALLISSIAAGMLSAFSLLSLRSSSRRFLLSSSALILPSSSCSAMFAAPIVAFGVSPSVLWNPAGGAASKGTSVP
mmetsp:Transcript_10673/g.25384  ORF Transcript_10673/g.25384 Transcript_10673/m.25384 type:complete len:249 (-) Transcript_10673:682-1428(-)